MSLLKNYSRSMGTFPKGNIPILRNVFFNFQIDHLFFFQFICLLGSSLLLKGREIDLLIPSRSDGLVQGLFKIFLILDVICILHYLIVRKQVYLCLRNRVLYFYSVTIRTQIKSRLGTIIPGLNKSAYHILQSSFTTSTSKKGGGELYSYFATIRNIV